MLTLNLLVRCESVRAATSIHFFGMMVYSEKGLLAYSKQALPSTVSVCYAVLIQTVDKETTYKNKSKAPY